MVCKMTGGATVETEEDLRSLQKLPEMIGRTVNIGDALELEPCLPDHYLAEIQKQKGRPCPRPGLAMDPDNEAPLELMQVSLLEHTRHLFEGTLRDLVPRHERAAVRRRVAMALLDPVVTARLYQKRDAE
jgi:hypothetical protein